MLFYSKEYVEMKEFVVWMREPGKAPVRCWVCAVSREEAIEVASFTFDMPILSARVEGER